MSKKGCDVSSHNGTINWGAVKSDGIEFAILRVGYGMYDYQKDKQFENYYAGATSVGIPVGVYLYSYAKSVAEAEREADCAIKWLGGRKLNLPVYFDIEDPSQQKLGRETLDAMCRAFCNKIEKAGYWAGIYSSKYWATNVISGAELGRRYTYWVAQYNNACTYTGDYAIWQNSSSGRVAGIKGNVDTDVMVKDIINGGNTPKPIPTPTPIPRKQKLYLPADAKTWRVYPLNKKPVKGNECGLLKPSKFGGLEYDIIRFTQPNVAVIRTRDFGEVQIYVAPSTGAIIK